VVKQTLWQQKGKDDFAHNQLTDVSEGDLVRIKRRSIPLKLISGARCSGFRVSLIVDSIDVLANNILWGYNFAMIDGNTGAFERIYITGPLYLDPDGRAQQIYDFVYSLPEGTYVCGGIHDDGGFGRTEKLNQAMELMGSKYIRQVGFYDSWGIIGRRGAGIGSVTEGYRRSPGNLPDYSCDPNGPDSLKTPIVLCDTIQIRPRVGKIITPSIGPASSWKTLKVDVDTTGRGTSFSVDIIAIRKNGVQDTLQNIDLRRAGNLEFLNAAIYPRVQLVGNFYDDDGQDSPVFSGWSVEYTAPPELAINYQVVSLSPDSVLEGEPASLTADVYNIGFSQVDSVRVVFSATDPDSGRKVFFSESIPRIEVDSFRTVSAILNTAGKHGSQAAFIEIDPEDKITELYETNNFYTIPFFVRRDTIRPTMDITFDGIRIFDGDYVSSRPDIRIRVKDNSPLPIKDTADVRLVLDSRTVFYSGDQVIQFVPDAGETKAQVTYKPDLSDGEHRLKIIAKDASGNYADTTTDEVQFRVSGEPSLLNVYNFPNPFSKDTYFTFTLTGSNIPEEINIKIYTIAGRLIKEIPAIASQLRFGFNRIYWDGRDEDGDVPSNGVYLYKMVMKVGDNTATSVQKLAIMR
jgi:hypothetical protein